jgi:hypothetical protein
MGSQPTADRLNEARRMMVDLERLFEAGGENANAAAIRDVLRGDDSALYKWLTSGNFWGGMGSMIDGAFCTPIAPRREVDKRSQREFMRLIVKLGNYQITSGLFTKEIRPHIEKWTETFEAWLRQG